MAIDFQAQLQNLRNRKELLVIMIFLLVIVVLWIVGGILSSQRSLGITPEQRRLAEPLSPALDAVVIQKLEQKRAYNESELSAFPLYVTQGEPSSDSSLVPTEEANEPEVPPELLPDDSEAIFDL